MKQKTDFPKELCADEAVCFIADRHKVSPQQLLHYFFAGAPAVETAATAEMPINLEPNEVEILNGLSNMSNIENNR
mgnify:FL=1